MTSKKMCQQIMRWLDASPTAYHAVELVKTELLDHGFVELDESDVWSMSPGNKYFVKRRDASILAFVYGTTPLDVDGFRIIGAHTDSPVLKVKPSPEKVSKAYFQLGVEVYGGALLNPWFDRDLSIAGRVAIQVQSLENKTDTVSLKLIDFKRPIAFIPSLAIHLDRNANKERTVNPQSDMNPILLQTTLDGQSLTFRSLLADEFCKSGVHVEEDQVLDFDLSFYDTQGAQAVGFNQEFLASARLDNLLSSFVGLSSILESSGKHSAILALFDHEEVGSQSDIGARSNFLNAFIERLIPDSETRYRVLHRSMLLSLDNAHGVHPNYVNKHDDNHGPILNAGPVIKFDANQSYATSADTAGLLRMIANQANVPLQSYVTRSDLRCGSTIGPMSAAQTGIRTLDLGAATFAMHSIREIAGTMDVEHLYNLINCYLETRTLSL